MMYSAMARPADWQHLEKLGQSLKSINSGPLPSARTASPPYIYTPITAAARAATALKESIRDVTSSPEDSR